MRNRAVVISGVVVVVAFAAWFVFMPKVPTVRAKADARTEEPELALAPPSVVAPDPIAPPVVTAPVTTASAPEAPVPDAAVLPEPLPELDAFTVVPPGSERWTPEERVSHRDGLFEGLARREALLEREIAADAATKEQKRVTLEYLRARRDEIIAGSRTRPPRVDAEP